jgi:hypothetical protein
MRGNSSPLTTLLKALHDYCLIPVFFHQNTIDMQNFKTIETPVLITMLMAHTSLCEKKKYSAKELIDCEKIIQRLNMEIESRNDSWASVLIAKLHPAMSL